jgi:hypothetical protein
MNAAGSLTWSCVQLADNSACVDALESGVADAISVGASGAVAAAQKYGSQVVISEVSTSSCLLNLHCTAVSIANNSTAAAAVYRHLHMLHTHTLSH